MITVKFVTKEQAAEILNEGGMNWILYRGDTFDCDMFQDWTGHQVTRHDETAVADALERLDGDSAIEVGFDNELKRSSLDQLI